MSHGAGIQPRPFAMEHPCRSSIAWKICKDYPLCRITRPYSPPHMNLHHGTASTRSCILYASRPCAAAARRRRYRGTRRGTPGGRGRLGRGFDVVVTSIPRHGGPRRSRPMSVLLLTKQTPKIHLLPAQPARIRTVGTSTTTKGRMHQTTVGPETVLEQLLGVLREASMARSSAGATSPTAAPRRPGSGCWTD